MLLFLIICVVAVFYGLRNLAHYLALTEPMHGDYLIVEGWVDESSLSQAHKVFIKGRYKYLITTGGLDKHCKLESYAEKSARYFMSKGLPADKIIVIPTPESAQARTFLSAVMVRKWFQERSINDAVLDVFTEAVHAKRTHFLYKLAFRSTADVGVYASVPTRYELPIWWKTSDGAKLTLTELFGFIWAICFFEPAELNSHSEMWGINNRQGSLSVK